MPIKRTVDIILKRTCNDKVINTNLKKRILKELILDSGNKTAFSSNIYDQINGVSMGSSLGPMLANIIMSELQPFKRQNHKIVKHTQTICREITDKLFECV